MEYYLVSVTYKCSDGLHCNTTLVKANSIELAEKGIKDDALKQGLKDEDIVSVKVHETLDLTNTCCVKNKMESDKLSSEELADQIMRWDWRDSFREENKKTIIEMFEAYGAQEQINKQDICKHTVDDLLYKTNGIAKCKCGDEWHF
jgi:hypothetical protein